MKVAAIVTPKEKNRWDNKFYIAINDLYSLTNYLNTFGFFDILFLGYTGEGYELSMDEVKEVLKFAEEYKFKIKKKGKVIINITRNEKKEIKEIMEMGEWCDYFMINRNNLDNKSFFSIIKNSKKPIIYYLSCLSEEKDKKKEFLEFLINEEKIVGIKDSLEEGWEDRKRMIEGYGKVYFFGRDLNFLKEKKGNVISGTIQLFPQLWREERYDLIERIVKKIEEKEKEVRFPEICKYFLSYSPPFVPLIKGDDVKEENLKKLEDLKEFYVDLKRKNKF